MPFFLQRMLLTFLVVIRTHGSCQMMQKRVTWHPGFFFHSFMERKTASDALLHRLAAPSQKRTPSLQASPGTSMQAPRPTNGMTSLTARRDLFVKQTRKGWLQE